MGVVLQRQASTPCRHPATDHWKTRVWLDLPASFPALQTRGVAGKELSAWRAIYSWQRASWPEPTNRSHPYGQPCFQSQAQIGKEGIGAERKAVARYLERLEAAGLLLTVELGWKPGTKQHQCPARFALHPWELGLWKGTVQRHIHRLAEKHGKDSKWHDGAMRLFWSVLQKNQRLRKEIDRHHQVDVQVTGPVSQNRTRAEALPDSLLLHVQAYAARGWKVFPTRLNKRPAVRGWQEKATSSVEDVKELWDAAPEAAGAAMATGKPSGLWVLDVDGPEGRQQLRRLEEIYGPLPDTVTARTGGEGSHLFFQMPPDREVRNSVSRIAPGIDVRGTGGFAVLSPSPHPSGRSYRWEEGKGPSSIRPAAAPSWLLELAAPPDPEEHVTPDPAPLASLQTSQTSTDLEAECLRVATAPVGTRNNELNRSAFVLAKFAVAKGLYTRSEVEDRLTQAAAEAGLKPDETSRTLASAFKAGLLENENAELTSRVPKWARSGVATRERVPAVESRDLREAS